MPAQEQCPKCKSRDITSERQRYMGGSSGDRECNGCGYVNHPSAFVVEPVAEPRKREPDRR